MSCIRLSTLSIWLSLALASSVKSQVRPDPLAGYIREALRSNLSLAQSRLSEDQADARTREARALRLPSVSFSTRRSETSGGLDLGDLVNPAYRALNQITGTNRFPTDVGLTLPLRQESRVRVAQPIYQPAIGAGIRAASSAREAESAAVRAAARQLIAQVETSYWQVASAARVAELYRATLPLVNEHVRVNERMLANGTVTAEAVLRARAERSEVQQQLADAEQQRSAAARSFNALLDRSLDSSIDLPSDEAVEKITGAADSLTIDELVRHAIPSREELRQATFAIDAAAAQEKAASAAFRPTVGLALDYGIQGDEYRFDRDHDALVASVVVEWNAFNGGRDEARRQQASIAESRARLARRDLERRIELDVRQAYEAVQVARAAIVTAEDRVAAAQRGFELVARRHAEGLASQIEYIDARTSATRAALNLIVTRQSYAVRRADLERAAALVSF